MSKPIKPIVKSSELKVYGYKCKKCDSIVTDTSARDLVYATNDDAALELLQDSIKEHDSLMHGDDGHLPSFRLYTLHLIDRTFVLGKSFGEERG